MVKRVLPGIGLTGFWPQGDDDWKPEMDANLRALSALVQPRVISVVNATPDAPVQGDIHFFGGTHPTNANSLALYDDGAWAYVPAFNGLQFFSTSDNKRWLFTGGALTEIVATGAAAAASGLEVLAGTLADKFITPDALGDAAQPVIVPYAANIVLDGSLGANFEIGALTGNVTLANMANVRSGRGGTIRLFQDGVGGRTLAVGSNWRFPGGLAANALSTAANAVDVIAYQVTSAGLIKATLAKDFKA